LSARLRRLLTVAERSRRADFLKRLPWIKWLKEGRTCDGYRYNRMPVKAMHDSELKEKYRCKNPAHWKYKTLKKSWAEDGVYCMAHLYANCIWDMHEMARVERWIQKHS